MTTAAEMADLEAARNVPGWRVMEYRPGGELRGFALVRGTEFHCQLFQGAGFNRQAMREFLRPAFEVHGCLNTRVPVHDTANVRFNRVFGFERTWSDAHFHYFLMSELPFGKDTKPCQ